MKNTSCTRIEANIEQISDGKQIISELENSIDLLANALNLAGNQVRLKILFLLSKEQKLCVCDLSDILSMKISAVSQHLRKLKDGNLIKSERKAQTIFYSLTDGYKTLLSPFFILIEENQIVEQI